MTTQIYSNTTIYQLIKDGKIKVGDIVTTSKDVTCDWHKGKKITSISIEYTNYYEINVISSGPGSVSCFCSTAQSTQCDITVQSESNQSESNQTKPTKSNFMSTLIEKFRQLTASKEEKLLVKHGVENPLTVPTELGYQMSREIQYKKNREEISKAVVQIEEEEQKEKE